MRRVSHSAWLYWSARELWGSAIFHLELELWIGPELSWLLAICTQVPMLVWQAHYLRSHLLSPWVIRILVLNNCYQENIMLLWSTAFKYSPLCSPKGFFSYFFSFLFFKYILAAKQKFEVGSSSNTDVSNRRCSGPCWTVWREFQGWCAGQWISCSHLNWP